MASELKMDIKSVMGDELNRVSVKVSLSMWHWAYTEYSPDRVTRGDYLEAAFAFGVIK